MKVPTKKKKVTVSDLRKRKVNDRIAARSMVSVKARVPKKLREAAKAAEAEKQEFIQKLTVKLIANPLKWAAKGNLRHLKLAELGQDIFCSTFVPTVPLMELVNSAVEGDGFPDLYAAGFHMQAETATVKMEGTTLIGKRTVKATDSKTVRTGRYELRWCPTIKVHGTFGALSEDMVGLGTHESAYDAMMAADDFRLQLMLVALGLREPIDHNFNEYLAEDDE